MQFATRPAVLVGVGLLAAWLVAAASIRPTPAGSDEDIRPANATASALDPLAAEVRAQGERLHERLRVAPVPREPLRNPFEFAARPDPEPVEPARAAVVPEAAAGSAMATPPTVNLIGIAEDRSPQGVIRIAIVSGPGDVSLLHIGDTYAGRFEVTAIGAEVVELTDLETGTLISLALK